MTLLSEGLRGVGLLSCLAAFLLATALFLPHQSLWVDETTQLTGVSLSPVAVVKWLVGEEKVPGMGTDRAPPVSYWAGQLWSACFGLDVRGLRWFGVMCVALALVVVFEAARRAFGTGAGVAAGWLFATSPNLVYMAPEIRSYPLFILISALGFYCLVRYCQEPTYRWMAALATMATLGMYIHFFGIVMAAAWMCASVLYTRRQHRPWRPVAGASCVLALLTAGVWPFVRVALAMSPGEPTSPSTRLREIVRWGYRLCAHPALGTGPLVAALAVVGFLMLLAVAVWNADADGVARTLLVAVGVGALTVVVGKLMLTSFDATNPNYSLWLFPGLFLVLCSGFKTPRRAGRQVAYIGLAFMVSANLYACTRLVEYGASFAHGPADRIARLLQDLGPDNVTVLYDDDQHTASNVSFPIRYLFDNRIRQFTVQSSQGGATAALAGRLQSLDRPGDPAAAVGLPDLPVRGFLVVVDSHNVDSAELNRTLGTETPWAAGPVQASVAGLNSWRDIEQRQYPGFVSARVDVFQPIRKGSGTAR